MPIYAMHGCNNSKSSYMKNKNVGFDIIFRKQIIINPKTDLWAELFIHSNIFYKLLVLGEELYYPGKHTKIFVDKFRLLKNDVAS